MLPLIRRSVGHAENQVTTDAPEQDHALTSGGSKHRHLYRLAGESRDSITGRQRHSQSCTRMGPRKIGVELLNL